MSVLKSRDEKSGASVRVRYRLPRANDATLCIRLPAAIKRRIASEAFRSGVTIAAWIKSLVESEIKILDAERVSVKAFAKTLKPLRSIKVTKSPARRKARR